MASPRPPIDESEGSVARGRVGVSPVFQGLSEAPDARRRARLACAAAAPSSREVVRFDDRPLGVLLAAAPDQAAFTNTVMLRHHDSLSLYH